MHGLGYYKCFCKEFASESDLFEAPYEGLCDDFTTDGYVGLALSNSVTVLVSVVNIILRTVNIKLIGIIGIDTLSY